MTPAEGDDRFISAMTEIAEGADIAWSKASAVWAWFASTAAENIAPGEVAILSADMRFRLAATMRSRIERLEWLLVVIAWLEA